jgi:hypothetical protein
MVKSSKKINGLYGGINGGSMLSYLTLFLSSWTKNGGMEEEEVK